jgi:hypothetical protein
MNPARKPEICIHFAAAQLDAPCYSGRVMPIALAPITPSGPPPVYCTECGCEVDPAAWLCANCGKNLHEPDATTSMPPAGAVTHQDPEPSLSMVERVFPILLLAALFVVADAVKWHEDHPGTPGHISALVVLIQVAALVLSLWIDQFFGFYRLWRR